MAVAQVCIPEDLRVMNLTLSLKAFLTVLVQGCGLFHLSTGGSADAGTFQFLSPLNLDLYVTSFVIHV